MKCPNWTALSNRFKALADEHEFSLIEFPKSDSDAAFSERNGSERLRFVFTSSSLHNIIIGESNDVTKEFVLLNRFRWLSWAAGLALDPYKIRDTHLAKESAWWLKVKEMFHSETKLTQLGNGTDARHLSKMCIRSAQAAKTLSATKLFPTSAVNSSYSEENWRIVQEKFGSLKETLPQSDEDLFCAIGTFAQAIDALSWQREIRDRFIVQDRSTTGKSFQKIGDCLLWGTNEAITRFVRHAEAASSLLPAELLMSPPMYLRSSVISYYRYSTGVASWIEFLRLMSPGQFIYQQSQKDTHIATMRCNPFVVSGGVVNQLTASTGSAVITMFRRNLVSACPWLSAEDRIVVSNIVELRSSATNRNSEPDQAGDQLDDSQLTCLKLLRVYTGAIADTRFIQANSIICDRSLTVNDRLEKLHGIFPIPDNASAKVLSSLLCVTPKAVITSRWWISNRKGRRNEDSLNRMRKHQKRAEEMGTKPRRPFRPDETDEN